MQAELDALSKALEAPKKPVIAIVERHADMALAAAAALLNLPIREQKIARTAAA